MVNEKPVPASPCGQYIKTTIELGKGTQRIVHKGNDLRNGRCVAWCEPKFKGEKEWETFTKTSTLLENVHHKNIVAFLDFWEASPTSSRTPVLITELLGCTLKQHLHTSPRSFEQSSIRSWAHQLLEAIVYLHSHHHLHHVIVHRTIRCDHVCINTNTGDIKLSSFGSAILKERGRYLEEVVGLTTAVEFMSPEMVNEHYHESTDIYSYGICLLEMATLEYPYEECDKASQTLTSLKNNIYPRALEGVKCYYTNDLIKRCLEHDVTKRLTLDQILNHPFFQTPMPTGWPKIVFQTFDGDMITISVSYSEAPDVQQLYSFNLLTDNSRYVAASLVRGEFIKETHLQDAAMQLHKIMEKVKRQTRIKSDLIDYYPLAQPIPVTKSPVKTPKGVVLKFCDFDIEEQHVELELSQARIGKVVKFQFGIMDNEAEEIAERLVTEGHLIADNKAEFIAQLLLIVEVQRTKVRSQQEGKEEEGMEEDGPSSPSAAPSEMPTDLNIEVRRKLSRENSSNANVVTSPDIDSHSVVSESSSNVPIDSFTIPQSMTNGLDGTVISPPIVTSRGMTVPNYYRPPANPLSQQHGMVFYPPQYMMMPGGITSPGMPGPHHQIPSNYVMMPAGHIPYTNGHMGAWPHGAPIPAHGTQIPPHGAPISHGASMGAAHGATMPAVHAPPHEMQYPHRTDQDTPPPSGYLTDASNGPDT